MKNLKLHSEIVFGSILNCELNLVDDDVFEVKRILDNENIFYAVYNDYDLALSVYEQQKFLPVTGG